MASVGILSMQRIANYGSFLQAYALKSIIDELGHQPIFIDYHVGPPVIATPSEGGNRITRLMKKGMETFSYDAPLVHKLSFIQYKRKYANKYLPLLGIGKKRIYTPHLDYLVIGSDEVFNCIQTNTNVGFSPELFGADNHAKKVITYAASFGNTTLDKLQQYDKDTEIGLYLSNLEAISVRDSNSGAIVRSLTNKIPEYHLDPVLAYDYMGKNGVVPDIKVRERYLILYAYSGRITDKEADWIDKYAKSNGLKIYAIGGIQKHADRFIDCSPFEVLSYFQNAEEVITDTFHGSIFSIITHKPFATLVRKSVGNEYGNEEKLTDLLKRLELQSRMTTNITEVAEINATPIDYDRAADIIQGERLRTYQYLSNELSK